MVSHRTRTFLRAGLLVGALGIAPSHAQAAIRRMRQVRPPPAGDTVPPADSVPAAYILEPITVTAARERATAPPVATITVDPVELRRTQSENPYDLVRRVAGLEVHDQGQGPGFASNVVMRGFTADHSSDLLLEVDGVPVNLPVHGHVEGYADWSYLFPGAVASLRVVHGPSSPLHGDFALAGAVEVYTRADADGTVGAVTANAFGDVGGWVTSGRRAEDGGALVGLELRRARGWKEQSDRTIGKALVRGWRSVNGGRLEGGLGLYGADWESPGFVSAATFARGDIDGVADRTDGGDQVRGVAHGRYALPVGTDRYLEVMGWGIVSDWDLFLTVPGHADAVGGLYQTFESDRRWSAGGQAEWSWIPSVGELTLGVEGRHDVSAYDQGRSLRRVGLEDFVALDARHSSVSAYGRWRWRVTSRLGLDLGARVDHLRHGSYNRLGLETSDASRATIQRALVASPMEGHVASYHPLDEAGPVGEWVAAGQTLVSPKLGMQVRMHPRWSLMASSSRGFRSAVGVVGDPDRPAVVAWAHELGVDYDGRGMQAHLSLFRSDVDNERIQDPITLEISSAGSSVRQGVEAFTEVELGRGVRVYGRATLTDATLSGRYADAHDDHGLGNEGRDGGDPNASQPVPGIARYIGQISVEGPLVGQVEGRVEWRSTGSYVPIGEPDTHTEPFSTFDAALRYPISRGLTVELESRNLLDRVYAEMRSSGYVSPGTPRSLGLSIRMTDPVR